MDKIAITITNLRKEKGWSQTDAAFDKKTVSRLQEIQNMDSKSILLMP